MIRFGVMVLMIALLSGCSTTPRTPGGKTKWPAGDSTLVNPDGSKMDGRVSK